MSERHQQIESQRAGEWRTSSAARWLERYGERIDCDAICQVASISAVAAARLNRGTALLWNELANLLQRHQAELLELWNRPIPGMSESVADLLHAADEAGVRGLRVVGAPLPPTLDRLQREDADLLQRIKKRAADRLTDVPARFSEYAEVAQRQGVELRSRAPDHPLNRACFEVARWCRAHRVDGSRQRGREWLWFDVAICLVWHGHEEIERSKDPAERCRKSAARWERALAAAGDAGRISHARAD